MIIIEITIKGLEDNKNINATYGSNLTVDGVMKLK